MSPDYSVTVVVPVYNGAAYIAEALGSVLGQSPAPEEVIVVDDGSTDDTQRIVTSLPVTYVRQNNAGPAAARNVGIEMAKGDLIAFIDADDLWPDDKLARHLVEFAADSSLDAVLGRYQLWALSDEGEGFVKVGAPAMGVNLGAGVYRRRLFADLGPLKPEAVPSEDVEWYLRIRESGAHLKHVDDVTLEYRLHSTNITGDRNNANRAFLEVLGDSIRRRRSSRSSGGTG